MTDIYNSKLIELLPPNLQNDNDAIAVCSAIDKGFIEVVDSIKNVLTFADIDNASSEVVDLLAFELNTDFYDNTLPLYKRKEIVNNALIYHLTKGTPYAVELLVTNAFDDGLVEEWFEYGGDPFYFKITTSDAIIDVNKVNQLVAAVNSVKNERSRLESININRPSPLQKYVGLLISGGDIITISTNIPT